MFIDVRTKTLQEYIHVIKYALECGYIWSSGSTKINEYYWSDCGEGTIISIDIKKYNIYYTNYYTSFSGAYLMSLKEICTKLKYLKAFRELV